MSHPLQAPGPFRVEHLPDGSSYELSEGHPIQCLPTGGNGTGPNGRGFMVLDSDPTAPPAGVDAGIALSNNTLRAPDVAVGIGPERRGWSTTVPPLAVEYAADGQDNADLLKKIDEFLTAGTRWVWVVRLTGPRRVEVHERGMPVRVVPQGENLEAPGLLKNAVPVEALFDRGAAQQATLRNLVQQQGYDSFEDALRKNREAGRDEGLKKGRDEGLELGLLPLQRQFARRLGRALTEEERATLLARFDTAGPERLGDVVLDLDPETLGQWLADPEAR